MVPVNGWLFLWVGSMTVMRKPGRRKGRVGRALSYDLGHLVTKCWGVEKGAWRTCNMKSPSGPPQLYSFTCCMFSYSHQPTRTSRLSFPEPETRALLIIIIIPRPIDLFSLSRTTFLLPAQQPNSSSAAAPSPLPADAPYFCTVALIESDGRGSEAAGSYPTLHSDMSTDKEIDAN